MGTAALAFVLAIAPSALADVYKPNSIVGNRPDSDNSAIGSGGGINVSSATATVANTILALNDTGAVDEGKDDCAMTGVSPVVTPEGHNLSRSLRPAAPPSASRRTSCRRIPPRQAREQRRPDEDDRAAERLQGDTRARARRRAISAA
jgi:hypothetical protein